MSGYPTIDVEPLPGVGPLTGALEAFADFFDIDRHLVEAAAEHTADEGLLAGADLRQAVGRIPENEKIGLLLCVVEGDSHVGAELRSRLRSKRSGPVAHRLAGALRVRAREIGEARTSRGQAPGGGAASRRGRRARAALDWKLSSGGVKRSGARSRRKSSAATHPPTIGRQASCPIFRPWTVEGGSRADFNRRLAAIRARHGSKAKFIERLTRLGHDGDERTS